jgi:hypothetical protein
MSISDSLADDLPFNLMNHLTHSEDAEGDLSQKLPISFPVLIDEEEERKSMSLVGEDQGFENCSIGWENEPVESSSREQLQNLFMNHYEDMKSSSGKEFDFLVLFKKHLNRFKSQSKD